MKPSEMPDEALFDAALACRTEAERAAYLDQACVGQPGLRRRVEVLLEAHELAGGFLETPATRLPPTVTLSLAHEESAGTMIGRYRLLQKIGEGGMGVVYLAEQTEPVVRQVALKIIKLGMDTRQVVNRFEAERQALALMDHPNIARVLDGGATETGRPYFVMELVRGMPITDYCDRNRLSPKERLELFIPVCQAIQHAHQKGIIHRDIKPSNVMVTLHDGQPVPRVIDFGVAKAINQRLTEKTLFTNYATMIGTPAYMSPEQADLSGLDIDTRTDVYSLGVLLYELLTGTTPFDTHELMSRGYAEMQRIIAEQDPAKPSTRLSTLAEGDRAFVAGNRNLDVPALRRLLQGDLDWIVMKCLEKDRRRRYETSNGLASDLRRHLNNEPVVARPPSRADRTQKWIKRHRVGFILGSAGAALTLAGLAVLAVANLQISSARRSEGEERARAIVAGRQLAASNLQLAETVRLLESQRVEDLLASGNAAIAVAQLAEIIRRDPWNRIATSRLVSVLIHRQTALLAWPSLPQGAPVTSLAVKADGITLLTASDDGAARLWDVLTGQGIGSPMQHPAPITMARFSPDGSLIAIGCKDGSVHLWNSETRVAFPVRLVHTGPVSDLNFDASGAMLVSASEGQEVSVWSVPEGRLVRKWSALGSAITAAAFVPGGASSVLICTAQGNVGIWNIGGGQRQLVLPGHQDYITSARFNRDGSRLLTASRDGTARLWDARNGTELIEPLRQDNWVLWAAFSPDEQLIVTTCQDGNVQFWRASDGRPRGGPLKHDGAVRVAEFSPEDGTQLATASLDVTARLWNVSTGELQCQPLWHGEMVTQVAFALCGSRLITGSSDTAVRIWNIQPRNYRPVMLPHTDEIYALAFSPDGKSVATGANDRTARLWDLATGRPLGDPLWHVTKVTALSFHPGGKLLATGGLHEAQVWDLETGQPTLAHPPRHDDFITWVEFSHNGERLSTASADGTARFWSPLTGRPLTASMKHGDVIWLCTFSPDDRWVATASNDHTARVWDAQTGEPVTPPLPHGDHVKHASFSPDSRRLVTSSTDNYARVWDCQTGQLFAELQHTRIVNVAWFSPDGQAIVTASIDRTARIWDANSGQALTAPMVHSDFVADARFSPDGARVATACTDGSVRLWDAKTGRPLTEPLVARQRATLSQLRFGPNGRTVVASGWSGVAAIWEVPPTPVPAPAWFADFAEKLVGLRVGAQGNAELAPRKAAAELAESAELQTQGDYYAEVARWLVADPTNRPRSPFAPSSGAQLTHPTPVAAGAR